MRYIFQEFVLDTGHRELRRGNAPVSVEPKVFDLLAHLLANRDRVVSKDDLIEAVWGGRIVSDSALTTCINAARVALGDSGEAQRLIKTLPRKGIRFVGDVRCEDMAEARTARVDAPPPPRSLTPPPVPQDKPSVAVLAFANLGGDDDQDYLSDGIADDIITELSRFSELFVIARNSSFQYKGKAADVRRIGEELNVRYVLEGSVRRAGGRIRISAQLINASTGAHLWAERYDRQIADVFAIQDEMARTIVPLLVAHVNKAEIARVSTRVPSTWEAYDHFLKGVAAFHGWLSTTAKEHLLMARHCFEQALKLDPNYARAYAGLSSTYSVCWMHKADDGYANPKTLDHAAALALQAVQCDPLLPRAHSEQGYVSVWRREYRASLAGFERAIALNPNYFDWRYCTALTYDGQFEKSVQILQECMRRDPFYPPVALGFLGIGLHMQKRLEEALVPTREFAARLPNHRGALTRLAAICAQLGLMDEARKAVAELLRLDPEYCIHHHVRLFAPHREQAHNEYLWEGLRLAGLPE